MNARMTSRIPSIATGFLGLVALLLSTGVATARTEVLRWTHPDPSGIARFEALVGTSSGNYGAPVFLGLPTPDSDGVFSASIEVADDADVYFAMQAVNDAGEVSPPSNERYRAAPSTTSGGTTSGTGSTGGTTSGSGLETGSEIPATADALLRFDFASGSQTDWQDTTANNGLSADDSLFSVQSIGGNPALTTQSTDTNIHSHFVGEPSDLTNVVYTGRMAIASSGGGVGVTAYSQYPSADVYYRLRVIRDGDTFQIANHYDSCSGDTNTGVTAQPGVWYEFEFTVSSTGSANRITAKVWKQGDAKPSSPQADCEDSASGRPGSGTIGVWSMGSGEKLWDDLEVSATSSGGSVIVSEPLSPPVLISIDPVQ
jgi:hypothetical protein